MTEVITIDEKNLLDDKDPDINNTKSTTPSGYSFKGDRADEKELLKGMGFEEDLINVIYNNMNR